MIDKIIVGAASQVLDRQGRALGQAERIAENTRELNKLLRKQKESPNYQRFYNQATEKWVSPQKIKQMYLKSKFDWVGMGISRFWMWETKQAFNVLNVAAKFVDRFTKPNA